MTKVKICGLSRTVDIEYVNLAKPEYVGFVFAESKRKISFEKAKELKALLSKDILAAGVFVNADMADILTLLNNNIIDIAQLHGDESEEYIKELQKLSGKKVLKAFKLNGDSQKAIQQAEKSSADMILFDSGAGSGETFNWDLLKGFSRPFFLAGGLGVENIYIAVEKFNPYALDLSSGAETEGFKDKNKIIEICRRVKMLKGRFGVHGGQYIPETLMNELIHLEEQYNHYKNDPEFVKELNMLFAEYAGRPSLLYHAEKMSKDLGLNVYIKREDLNHTGSHKINNVLGQALLAKKIGKTRVIAETGAGQHGVATATAAALFGMECEVFMGEEDTERQALNVYRMELLGAKVHSVKSGTKTLKDATSEALREWSARVSDTHYIIGSVMGPHPFPTIVRDFQSIISKEAREQILVKTGRLPDEVVACVGGGSNAIGMFYNFINDKDVALVGCEAAGKGIDTEEHAASIAKGRLGIFHGMKSYFCQDAAGQISPVYSISAGLDYPGIGPEHSYLHDIKRADYVQVTDEEAVSAFEYLARTEGIICAIESAHAVAHVLRSAGEKQSKTVIICLSGRGDKDVAAIAAYRGYKI